MNNCCCGKKPLVLKIKKGESVGFPFALNQQGAPVDLTDMQVLLQVRENIEDTGVYLIEKTISTDSDAEETGVIINPTTGQFYFKINKEDIADMSTTKPYYMAIYLLDGDLRVCISANNFQVAQFLVLNP